MNSISPFPREPALAPPPRGLDGLPSWMRSRWAVILGVFALVGAGLALGWPWLVAFGLAPLVLSLLPCAVMCALGLCMMGGKNGGSCSQKAGGAGREPRPPQQDAA